MTSQIESPYSAGFIDLRAHTDESDGTYSPSELVALATRMGLDALAITDHDTLSFKGSDFSNDIAAVLHNAHDTKGGVVILDPTSNDTVKLAGVSKHQLAVNQGDFAFHA